MKISLFIFVMIVILSFTSCSKKNTYNKIETSNGVIIHRNGNIPANTNMQIQIKKILEIDGDKLGSVGIKCPAAFTCGKKYLYIAGFYSGCISKFSYDGMFVKKVGGRGNGPVEFTGLGALYQKKDTIFALDLYQKRVSKFDKNLNFIGTFNTKNVPGFIDVYKNRIIGISIGARVLKDCYEYNRAVTIYDDKLNPIDTLESIAVKFKDDGKGNPLKTILLKAISNDGKIYVPEMSEDKYCINIYNFKGKKIEEIHKSYRNIPFTEKYFKKNLKFLKRISNINNPSKNDIKYHLAIYNSMVDSKNRLWISTFKEEHDENKGMKFNIFDKGKYINSIYLNLDFKPIFMTAKSMKIIEDKLIIHDEENNKFIIYKILN